MKAFKTKSLKPGVSDQEIAAKSTRTVSFFSFEAAIALCIEKYPSLMGEVPIGYSVTEHGIEVVWG